MLNALCRTSESSANLAIKLSIFLLSVRIGKLNNESRFLNPDINSYVLKVPSCGEKITLLLRTEDDVMEMRSDVGEEDGTELVPQT